MFYFNGLSAVGCAEVDTFASSAAGSVAGWASTMGKNVCGDWQAVGL